MPKKLNLVRFNTPYSKSQSDRVIECIINAVEVRSPCLHDVANAARAMLTEPSYTNLSNLCGYSALDFSDRDAIHGCFQIQALFKKRSDLKIGIDTKQKALDSFLRSESICRETNRVLRDRTDPKYGARASLIHQMKRKISSLLGDLPDVTSLNFGFGSGSNVGCSKSTSVRMKLSADATYTVGCVPLLGDTPVNVQTWPGLLKAKAVRGSRFATVPKTSLTDRAINVEPIINTYLQKGYGRHIRSRLRTVGVNTKDQTLNQRLALIGSRDGSLATIDLSMASDTVAYILVMDLLPFEWFEALSLCRCPATQLPDGKWVILEKFSSMGNGYTFELETLIFWALLATVCPEGSIISAYGDDLICPSECYDQVISALELIGFIPNPEKSFGTGPFRESCGKDYWGGYEVRPVFLKEAVSAKEVFRLHNYFVRTMEFPGLPEVLMDLVPKHLVCYGPEGFGDGHLLSETGFKISYDKRGWDGKWASFHSWSAAPTVITRVTPGDYGAFIYLSETMPADGSHPSQVMYQERSHQVRYIRRTLRLRLV